MARRSGDNGYAPGWCIHYRGAHDHETCEKEVRYDSFQPRNMKTQPCFLDSKGQSSPEALPCPHLRRPTLEEIAAHKTYVSDRLEKLTLGMCLVRDDAAKNGLRKGRGGRGSVTCPVCRSGTLSYTVASYNGHIHGHCSTDGCLSWMQ